MLLLDSIAFRENLGVLTVGLDTIMGHKPEVHIEIVQGWFLERHLVFCTLVLEVLCFGINKGVHNTNKHL